MPESECAVCGELCVHTDEEEFPLCDLCQEARMWARLIRDVALGVVDVPDDFIDSIGKEAPIG